MRAGWLRHRVVVQEKNVTRNDYGEEIVAWTNVATLWASVEPVRGREYRAADSEQADISVKIRARYYAGILPTMRAIWNGHIYDIEQVVRPLEINREVILMCRENVP